MYKITNEHIRNGRAHPRRSLIEAVLREQVNDKIRASRGHFYCPEPLNDYAAENGFTLYIFSRALTSWVINYDYGKHVPEIEIIIAGDKVLLKGAKNDF